MGRASRVGVVALVTIGLLAVWQPAAGGGGAGTPLGAPVGIQSLAGGPLGPPRLLASRQLGSLGEERRPRRPEPHLLVRIPRAMPITARPGGGRVIGAMPAGSKYYGVPITAWVMDTARGGRFGKVTVPYSGSRRTGWIRLRGLRRETTWVTVRIVLSRHLLVVEKHGRLLGRFPATTGAPSSPTPRGRYFVTDRIPFAPGSYYGTFAFGISGIQTRVPAGWSGGNQLAIHGTNSPSTIGRSASAGCLRVSETALDRLKPLLRLGTPVVIRP